MNYSKHLEDIDNYLIKKMDSDSKIIICTFYEVRVQLNISKEEEIKFLELAKNKFENSNYKVYFTTAKYTYENKSRVVQDNELIVAIKE